MDMGVHCLDLIQYIVGSKAKKVVGFTDTKTFKYEVEDSASVIVQLENGANVYIDAYFNIPDAAAKGRMEIYGTKEASWPKEPSDKLKAEKWKSLFPTIR